MSAVMNDEILRHRFTVDDYYKMVEAGLLAPDARVELIEGEIIDMPPIGSRHAAMDSRLTELLCRTIKRRATVRLQLPIRLSAYSEPQPDVALVKFRSDFYANAHPVAADTLLAVEISQTSLARDRRLKIPLYARHHIPEVWLIDVKGERIHCFRLPDAGVYTDVSHADGLGDELLDERVQQLIVRIGDIEPEMPG
jgi:Uma2 family endonuclease